MLTQKKERINHIFTAAIQKKRKRKKTNPLPFIPSRTARAGILLDIRKITYVRVELSVQPRVSVVNHAPISVQLWYPHGYPLWYRCYKYPSAKFTLYIRICTDYLTHIRNSTDICPDIIFSDKVDLFWRDDRWNRWNFYNGLKKKEGYGYPEILKNFRSNRL